MTSKAGLLHEPTTSRTEYYDDMKPVGVDPRWETSKPFREYLLRAFPLVSVYHRPLTHVLFRPIRSFTQTLHAHIDVNSWGLVYVWLGSDNHLC